jgi:FkbM family methyltransferase
MPITRRVPTTKSNQIIWIEALEDITAQAEGLLNNYKGQTVLRAVLWDTTGREVSLQVSSSNAESSSIFNFNWHDAIHPHISKNSQISPESATLDDVIVKFYIGSIPDISLLVLDLQGAEDKALIASKSVLKNFSDSC